MRFVPPIENMNKPRNVTYEMVYNSALELFGNDHEKLNAWWMTGNEQFEGKAPYQLVKEGKGAKLLKIIRRCV